MKKVLLFCVVAMALAACGGAKKEEAKPVDSTTVKVDTAKVDTAKVDTTVKK